VALIKCLFVLVDTACQTADFDGKSPVVSATLTTDSGASIQVAQSNIYMEGENNLRDPNFLKSQ
jgi:hypothetical protein